MAIIEHTPGTELTIPLEGKFAVMFHLPGHCAGCKVALSNLQNKKLENVTVILVDAGDELNRDLINLYQASTAPTIIVHENGTIIGRMNGLKEFLSKNKELLGD